MLSDRQLYALSRDPLIQSCLKSNELQAVLQKIDASRSHLAALDAALHNIPEFRAFCESVLYVISTPSEQPK